jgi:hypothetical protein
MEFCGMMLHSCRCTNEAGTCNNLHRCTNDGCKGTWNDDGFPLTDPYGMTFGEFMDDWRNY